jgi:hypothetical protein
VAVALAHAALVVRVVACGGATTTSERKRLSVSLDNGASE